MTNYAEMKARREELIAQIGPIEKELREIRKALKQEKIDAQNRILATLRVNSNQAFTAKQLADLAGTTVGAVANFLNHEARPNHWEGRYHSNNGLKTGIMHIRTNGHNADIHIKPDTTRKIYVSVDNPNDKIAITPKRLTYQWLNQD